MRCTRYSLQILMRIEFSRYFLKKILRTSSFMKIGPVGAELLHADGRTDMTKLIVAFRSFAKGHEKEQQKVSYWETGMLFVF